MINASAFLDAIAMDEALVGYTRNGAFVTCEEKSRER